MRKWRRNVAHEYQYRDSVSGLSLAARVCNADAGLPYSATQAQAYEHLTEYLGENEWLNVPNGQLMCILAIACWYMVALADLRSTIRLARAVIILRGKETVLLKAEGEVTLTSLALPRVVFVVLVMMVRAGIAITLM